MKRHIDRATIVVIFLLPLASLAQKQERQMGDTTYYKTMIPETKQTLLKNMSMIANMNFAFRNEFVDGVYTQSRFRNEQFRLEFRGQVTDKVFFRFRDRYTRAQTSESVDNLSRSVDLAFIRVDISKKFSISAGKMCADWGAWEFDWNPIDIYEYSDIVEYADNFLTGVGFTYTPSTRNQWTFQILDSRTKSFNELYGTQPNFTESKAPLAFVSNWRGSLFDGKVKTIWSYSLFNEAQEADGSAANMNYIALGNEFNFGKFRFIYDFKWSDEQLDRTGIVSETVPDNLYPYALAKTRYIGHWLNFRYRLTPKVDLTLVAMLDIAQWKNSSVDGSNNPTGEEKIRDAYGFIPAVEFYPWKDLNMKFFVNYVGRVYDYTEYAEQRFGAADYSTGRFTIGFISPLGIF